MQQIVRITYEYNERTPAPLVTRLHYSCHIAIWIHLYCLRFVLTHNRNCYYFPDWEIAILGFLADSNVCAVDGSKKKCEPTYSCICRMQLAHVPSWIDAPNTIKLNSFFQPFHRQPKRIWFRRRFLCRLYFCTAFLKWTKKWICKYENNHKWNVLRECPLVKSMHTTTNYCNG